MSSKQPEAQRDKSESSKNRSKLAISINSLTKFFNKANRRDDATLEEKEEKSEKRDLNK